MSNHIQNILDIPNDLLMSIEEEVKLNLIERKQKEIKNKIMEEFVDGIGWIAERESDMIEYGEDYMIEYEKYLKDPNISWNNYRFSDACMDGGLVFWVAECMDCTRWRYGEDE